jgi:GPN-loop GTPase
MPFAQLVIGPPGSGKSTYCDGMLQFMGAVGRKCSVVNLDPANDHVSYPAAIDVRELVSLEEIMEAEELGPNGSVLYGLEQLEDQFEWLKRKLKDLGGEHASRSSDCPAEHELIYLHLDDYVLFDCPGQVELFTHHESLRKIFARLQKLGYRVGSIKTREEWPPADFLQSSSSSICSILLFSRGHHCTFQACCSLCAACCRWSCHTSTS